MREAKTVCEVIDLESRRIQRELDRVVWWSEKIAKPSREDILRYPILDPSLDDVPDIVA